MMTVVEPTVKQPEKKNAAGEKSSETQKVCWLEVKRYPYQPDHQMELMHLQAEADALLIKLQTRKSQTEHSRIGAQ